MFFTASYLLLLNYKAARAIKNLARNKACLPTNQERHSFRHVLRLSYSTYGRFVHQPFDRLLRNACEHIGLYDSRRNCIDRNSRGAKLFCKRLGKSQKRRLRHRIHRLARCSLKPPDRRIIDNSAKCVTYHIGNKRTADVKYAPHVGVHHLVIACVRFVSKQRVSADPRIVESPRSIPVITYAELRELAFMGASVLHEESILPVKEKGIPLAILNTNRPEDPGTVICDRVQEEEAMHERFITGVAGRKNFTIITVIKRDMNTSSPLRHALEILDRYHAHVEHITLGLDSFAFVTSTAALGDALFDVLSDIRKTCRPDDVRIEDNIALVAAVGRKMTFRPGISGRIFKALGENGVNIRTIAQGADELSIIIGVDNKNFETATRVLYEGFAG